MAHGTSLEASKVSSMANPVILSACNEADELLCNRHRDFKRAITQHNGLEMVRKAHLPDSPATVAALAIARAYCSEEHLGQDVSPSSAHEPSFTSLSLPALLKSRCFNCTTAIEVNDPFSDYLLCFASRHLYDVAKLHLGTAFDAWLQSLLDLQPMVAKPQPRGRSQTYDPSKRSSSASATSPVPSHVMRKASISMLSNIKWRRAKKQASALSPSTSTPSTPSTTTATTPLPAVLGGDNVRPNALLRLFVHGIERFANSNHARQDVIRYYDKASRQQDPSALSDLRHYRSWIEQQGWCFMPSNVKSGKGAKLRSSLRNITNFSGMQRPVLAASIDPQHYLVVLTNGVVITIHRSSDGVQVADADINHQLCPYIGDNDTVVSACICQQSLVMTTRQSCQVLVMAWSMMADTVKYKQPVVSPALPSPAAQVIATSTLLFFTYSSTSSKPSTSSSSLQQSHLLAVASLNPSSQVVKVLRQLELAHTLVWMQTSGSDPNSVWVVGCQADEPELAHVMHIKVDMAKTNTMEHKVRGQIVKLVTTSHQDEAMQIVRQQSIRLPAACTGFCLSANLSRLLLYTACQSVVALDLRKYNISIHSTSLPHVGCIAQHRHGWQAVASLQGQLQLFTSDWRSVRVSSQTEPERSRACISLADYGIAGQELACMQWLDTHNGTSHQLLVTPVQGTPIVLQLFGLSKQQADSLHALHHCLQANDLEAATLIVAKLRAQDAKVVEGEALDMMNTHLCKLAFTPDHYDVACAVLPPAVDQIADPSVDVDDGYRHTVVQLLWRYFRHLLLAEAYPHALLWATNAAMPSMLNALVEALQTLPERSSNIKMIASIAQSACDVINQRTGSAEVSFV
eukprot:TRINITY_DN11328_c0_g2_i3.p1 TRINITY_DN11328_c0_g2~~TRINITY_DN11328_c0_g2_i3.p1  ORF type:complete len:856 (+),score=161.59 TRINITY_DN11328_c0_g2_i3:2-2569(+)